MDLDLWTERTVTLPRAANFAVFCGVAVAMIVVEVLWSKYAVATDTRNRLQMAGMLALAAMVVAEGALKWHENRPSDQPRRRGFSIFPKDNDE